MEKATFGGFSFKKVKEISFRKVEKDYGIRIRYMDCDSVFISHDSWEDFISVATAIGRHKPRSFLFILNDFIKDVKRAYPEFYSKNEESIFDVLLELGFKKEGGCYKKGNIEVYIEGCQIKIRRDFRKNVVGEIVYFGKIGFDDTEFFRNLLESVS